MPPSADYLLLSTFEYDTGAPNYIQTFPVPRAITEMGIKMGVVIWKFKSNWGAEDYTCLYRVSSAVHFVRARHFRSDGNVVKLTCRSGCTKLCWNSIGSVFSANLNHEWERICGVVEVWRSSTIAVYERSGKAFAICAQGKEGRSNRFRVYNSALPCVERCEPW